MDLKDVPPEQHCRVSLLLGAKVSQFKSMIRPILAGVDLLVDLVVPALYLHPVQCTNTDNNSWHFTSLPLEEVALIYMPLSWQ